LTKKTFQLQDNPCENIELPSNKVRLPKYLNLEQSMELLSNANTKFPTRDYCMLMLFLSCGMRLSELVGIDLSDYRDDTLRIIGKGNKERTVYLNQGCVKALEDYIKDRNAIVSPMVEPAMFISKNRQKRLTPRRVQQIVTDCLRSAGLSNMGFSTHKLRHTAATLLYRTGNADMLALKEILGHEHVSTTEIYTHISDAALMKAAKSSPLASFKRPKNKVIDVKGNTQIDDDEAEISAEGESTDCPKDKTKD
ncbi:MAG: tyrosine-type recombinase/integrase, partial [Oscillospiraceae bacterium]